MIEGLSSIILIGFLISCFGGIYSNVFNTQESTDSYILPTISAYTNNDIIYITHKRGYNLEKVYLFINETFILDRTDFKIGDVIITNLESPCYIELKDNYNNLLFYGYF